MIRTQIYITKEEKEALDKLSKERNTTKSNIIREAIDQYVADKETEKKKTIMNFAGIWKDKKDIPDVRELRKGWGRR
ncbi:CopG family transcriptional regulator [Rhodohalobacter sulfatireducens]|uniref:Ribbon-helix-helix domain-containing protein n=1 Tax=Rhodohalobacter sulfatireducens TaxID=2911366 RepID=A0ABS9KIL7_9BACT|nr:CopG family transcriptional regulator [Rhodohalobacter sulfatireducens]MCG2590697.1 ribbon-helix-helix domain-containing protein [Rhodohalobacter sulfatireducens]